MKTIPLRPSSPTNVQASNITPTSVVLSWDAHLVLYKYKNIELLAEELKTK